MLSDLKKAFQPKGYVLGTTGPGFKDPFDAGIDAVKVAESVEKLIYNQINELD